MSTSLRSICIYCGSRPGARPEYVQAARQAGNLMAERGIRLVYGAGSTGMMGAVADGVLEAGGQVVGVIPGGLNFFEQAHQGLSEIHVVETMHERKALMESMSDALVALPGGFGTLDEMFEALTWAVLGIHPKPCGFLNTVGYWDPILQSIDHMLTEGFISTSYRALVLEDAEFSGLLDKLEGYVADHEPLWRP